MGEKLPRILPEVTTSTSLLGSFTCLNLRHGTDGFTSPPKEGALRIFSPEKSDGFGRPASTLISRPPKPLNVSTIYIYNKASIKRNILTIKKKIAK